MNDIFGEYVDKIARNQMTIIDLETERRNQLQKISDIRERGIITYISGLNNAKNVAIEPLDIPPFVSLLETIKTDNIDIVLATPGGNAETVEDLVTILRNKFKSVSFIIPGWAKSAGTIWAMSGDEILMGNTSSLGPIDAQLKHSGHWVSADAVLSGFDDILSRIKKEGMNYGYVPLLQTLTPGYLQECRNHQDFSKQLVKQWLSEYKFKDWNTHSSSGKPVTKTEKNKRALKIAKNLCSHSKWLTHSRSIKIKELNEIGLKITDYEENIDLNDAIMRYYTMATLLFNMDERLCKIYETINRSLQTHENMPIRQPQNLEKKEINNDQVSISKITKMTEDVMNINQSIEIPK